MDSPRKLLIQMSGAPGSGKSTIAALLSRSLNGVVINHDLIKSFFLSTAISFSQASKLSYQFDWVLAEDMINQGRRAVIIDSTCNYREQIEQGTALAAKYGFEYRYVECRVGIEDLDVLEGRMAQRVPMRSQRRGIERSPVDVADMGSGAENRASYVRWIGNPCRPDGEIILVDSLRSVEECLEAVLKAIVSQTLEATATGAWTSH